MILTRLLLALQRLKRYVRLNRSTSNKARALIGFKAGALLLVVLTGVFLYTRVNTPAPAYAATSSTINFQARLLTSAGAVVPDGTYNIEFKLYDSAASGASAQGACSLNSSTDDCWWVETRNNVTVKNGYLSVNLGSTTPFGASIPWDQELWLTMNVGGIGGPTWDGEMSPRTKLTAVPYAFRAAELMNDAGTSSFSADDLVQKSPSTIQSVNAAVAAVRLNQTGLGALLQLQGDGSDVFTVNKTGTTTIAGSVDINGATLDIGTASQSGGLVLSDGTSNTGTLQVASLGQNTVFTLPDPGSASATICLSTGNCGGSGDILDGGNTTGSSVVIGTNDTQALNLETDGTTRINIQADGDVAFDTNTLFVDAVNNRVGVGTATTTEALTVNGAVVLGTTTGTNAGALRWTGTDFQGYNGSEWVSLIGANGAASNVTVTKTANECVNNAGTGGCGATGGALQNDNELFFAVGANETWVFRFTVQANAAAAPDIAFAVAAPAGSTCVVSAQNVEDGAGISNLGCGVSSGTLLANTTNEVYEVTGTITTGGTAGNITLQWAQGAANAANVTVLAGSSLFASNTATDTSFFRDGGNAFGGVATIGTTDNFGLNIITNNVNALTISNTGVAAFLNSLEITGGLDNNGDGITEAGSITGVGSNITGSGALVLASGGGGNLTLDADSGLLILDASTLQRNASGTTTIDLNHTANTTLSLTNSDGTAVAGLSVEGNVSATSFSGDGANLTGLEAGDISSGTLSDTRLSSNVALLNADQTFTGYVTFNDGLVLAGSSSSTAGSLRWTGSDFEGYDGASWVSLTGGGGGSSSPAQVTKSKPSDETVNNSSTLQNDDNLSFSVGANETWTTRFVIQANSSSVADLKFAVTAPTGATCNIAFIDEQGSVSESGVGCGTASAVLSGTGNNEAYEIVATIENGANAGTVNLQWSQFTQEASDTKVLRGSFLTASIDGGGLQFLQGGNSFGSTAVFGTTDANGINFITNSTTALSLTSTGDASFTGLANLNGGLIIGNASSDTFTITSDAVTLTNGLNFDSNTLVIDSVNNRVGIGDAAPDNKLSINNANTADSAAQVSIYTNGTGNKGLVLQRTAGQSAYLFEAQDESGQALAYVNSSGEIGLGRGSGADGALIFHNSTNNNTVRLETATAGSNRVINLADEDGTVCIQDSLSCGFLIFGTGTAQVDSGTDSSVFIDKTGASGNILQLQRSGNDVFVVDNNGGLAISNSSTAALVVKNSSGTTYFNVDTTGELVQIGNTTADATGVLLVLDTKNTPGDPTGGGVVNGSTYYNSSANKFRCYENGAWQNCLSASNNTVLVNGLDASAAATNLAATTLNCVSDPSIRGMFNLEGLSKLRWIGRIGGSIVAANKIRLQYHTGGNIAVATGDAGWTTLDTSAGTHTLNTWFETGEIAIPAGAQVNRVVLRACLFDGNGVADPTITGIQINAYN